VCKLLQYKIGGFKLNDNKADTFKPAQEIITYFEIIDDQYILRKIVTKSKFARIKIELDYL
jgi:replicative DNA helicase